MYQDAWNLCQTHDDSRYSSIMLIQRRVSALSSRHSRITIRELLSYSEQQETEIRPSAQKWELSSMNSRISSSSRMMIPTQNLQDESSIWYKNESRVKQVTHFKLFLTEEKLSLGPSEKQKNEILSSLPENDARQYR